jgi:hypothetical protein
VPGSSTVAALHVGPDGLVYGLAAPATFFAFDPAQREVLRTEPVPDCGAAVFGDLLVPDGNGYLYSVLSQGIMRVTMKGLEIEELAAPQANITGGVAVVDGRIYFAIGSHLWSYALPQ